MAANFYIEKAHSINPVGSQYKSWLVIFGLVTLLGKWYLY
jgi:hypothetical protein